jgi:beta-glucanase (GH16 family)
VVKCPASLLFLLSLSALHAQPGWKLVFSDEFDGPAGAAPDASKWVYDLGGNGWGNRELEIYTNKPENVSLDGKGHLAITAIKDSRGFYTSGRIKTAGKFEFTYGRVAARLRLPFGQGIWPAFWMLGSDVERAGWPRCGEIDIMENIGKEPNTVHATVHGPGYSGAGGIGDKSESPQPFAGDFHIFEAVWSKDSIQFLVDGKAYHEVTPRRLPQGAKWVYDHPFFLLLNVAVGGNWPGYPDATTQFPQRLLVDWVRVWQR